MKIKHIFFDLDHTLWDFNKNAEETLSEIYEELNGSDFIPSFSAFYNTYIEVNERLWGLYRNKKISKASLRTTRFNETFESFNLFNPNLAQKFGDEYVRRGPYKSHLFPDCHKVLSYLKSRYQLHIITNGFEEVQAVKMQSSNLNQYFDQIITSEKAGVTKPHPQIFEYALAASGAKASESIMIGDNFEVDCVGAENSGIAAVYFNPDKLVQNKKVSYEVAHLKELLELF
jgi:putative hydrolase of the HAD superfamily